MADAQTLALTDDEAAAIAVHARGAWRTPLPTVEETDGADLAAAILRGRRSLAIRDLATPGGVATGEAAIVLAKLGTGPCAAFMLIDSEGNWVQTGPTVYLYGPAPGDVEMSHVVTASGVHYFRVAPPPGQWLALTELAEAVFEDGFTTGEDGARRPVAALLSVIREGQVRTVRVAQKEAGTAGTQEPTAFASVDQAVSWVVHQRDLHQ